MSRRFDYLAAFFSLYISSGLVALAQQQPNTIPHLGEVRGQVRMPGGQPAVRGTAVYLEMRGGGTAGQSQTDGQGKFEFAQLSPAIYEVHIRAVGYLADFQEVDLTSIPMAYLTFVLRPEPSSRAPAVPPEGPGATISAIDPNAPEGARKNVASAQELMTQGNDKDIDKSIGLLKKAVAQYPQYSQAYLLMGVAYSSQKNWDDAEKVLQKSVELNQKNAATYVALGSVENEKKKASDAEKYLLKAVELAPDSSDAHFELGRAYWGLGKWDLADQHVAKANQLKPDNFSQRVLMGNILLRERNAPAALKEFQEAVRINPTGPASEPVRQMIARIEAALQQAEAQKK